jgi:hypothetical protein
MKIRDVNNKTLVIYGVSGPLSISAIKKLQQILNLSMYGICGPEVLWESPYVAIPSPKPLLLF